MKTPQPAAPLRPVDVGELRALARAAWLVVEPRAKAAAAAALRARLESGGLRCDVDRRFGDDTIPGRPSKPALVPPARVPQRGLGKPAGRIALLHAVAHIEFNAINLALDAVWRFDGLPAEYYRDWTLVAAEEAVHFGMLADELAARGAAYGDLDAHDGLWDMAVRTAGDPLARMALVPRLLEARGLDVTPALQRRLAQADDSVAVAILQRILDDEIGHVAIGNRWYGHLCRCAGIDPVQGWDALALRFGAAPPRPPFNVAARRQAGFSEDELGRWT